MKIAFSLFIALCLLSACSKKGNQLTPTANTIVGEWQWVNVYMYRDMYLTPKSTFNKGIITFTADGKFLQVKPDGTTENGTYILAKAKATTSTTQGVDSILYNQTNTSRPAYEVLNANFDYYMISGDTLKIGGINAIGTNSDGNYGLTHEYVRTCTQQATTATAKP